MNKLTFLKKQGTKLVQGERKSKSQRENVIEKLIFLLLSEAEIQ